MLSLVLVWSDAWLKSGLSSTSKFCWPFLMWYFGINRRVRIQMIEVRPSITPAVVLLDAPNAKNTRNKVPEAPKPAWIARTTKPAILVRIDSWKFEVFWLRWNCYEIEKRKKVQNPVHKSVNPPAPKHGTATYNKTGAISTKNKRTKPKVIKSLVELSFFML